jgi:pyridoxine 4-dehydrogenase
MAEPEAQPARRSGTFAIGGDLAVVRLGYGAMRLTGPRLWGPPEDPDEAIRVLRRAVELGVTLIDTADVYGPYVNETLIRRALHPYPDDVVVATKAGLVNSAPGKYHEVGIPAYLRQEAEMSLRRLGVDCLDLFQLHRIDPRVPVEDQIGELVALQADGKVRHVGVCEVSLDQLVQVRAIAPVATVQNRYNLTDRGAEDVLDYCERHAMGFIPWFPLATGNLARPDGPLHAIAEEVGATASQLALAWLLHRSPVVLPIPGTSSVAHLEENAAAATIALTDDQMTRLDQLA